MSGLRKVVCIPEQIHTVFAIQFSIMITHLIDASLTTQSLTFRPGNPVNFGVVVINRSGQFAAFELKIVAAAGNQESNWYCLSPEVSVAKPPGDRTQFQVTILESPPPHIVGTVNLTVTVSSPQLATERNLLLRLTVEPTEEAPLLRATLPTQRLQVYPLNTINITIQLRNLGSCPSEIAVYLKGIDLTWLIGTAERRLQLQAGQQTEVSFQCCPPGANQALSQDYPFTIVVRDQEKATASASGILEVLAVGFVKFSAQPSQQHLPPKRRQLRHWLSNTAIFQLQLKNLSNLLQQVAIDIQGKDCQSCKFQVNPETADLSLAKETSVKLIVQVKRFWIGRVRNLQIEAKARLSDRRLNIEPVTQSLTLRVMPIVPTWVLLLLLALLSALLVVLLQQTPTHLAAVNTVRFNGISGRFPLVLSGAGDCTIRSWESESSWIFDKPGTLLPQGTLAEGSIDRVCNSLKPQSLKGLLAVTGQAVRVLELIPENNDQVFVGLEKGGIQVWNVNTGRYLYSLKDGEDKTNDRVLSLALTGDSRYLYSSYGSGAIRKWQIPLNGQPSSNPQLLKLPEHGSQIQVWAIALSPDEKVLVSAGQYKTLIRWDLSILENPIPTQILLPRNFGNTGNNAHFWSIAFPPKSAPKSHLLATADSDGFITLWNLQKCQSNHLKNSSDQLPQTECHIYARWQASPQDILAIRFSPDGKQLISAGKEGKIVAWTIPEKDKTHDPPKQEVVDKLPHGINSLDVAPTTNHKILIASGGQDFKVRLYRLKQR